MQLKRSSTHQIKIIFRYVQTTANFIISAIYHFMLHVFVPHKPVMLCCLLILFFFLCVCVCKANDLYAAAKNKTCGHHIYRCPVGHFITRHTGRDPRLDCHLVTPASQVSDPGNRMR